MSNEGACQVFRVGLRIRMHFGACLMSGLGDGGGGRGCFLSVGWSCCVYLHGIFSLLLCALVLSSCRGISAPTGEHCGVSRVLHWYCPERLLSAIRKSLETTGLCDSWGPFCIQNSVVLRYASFRIPSVASCGKPNWNSLEQGGAS